MATDDQNAAVTGARAVAAAVSKVADAAVAEVSKTPSAALPDIFVSGSAGGGFEVRGTGLGSSGVVTLNGQQVRTTEWSTLKIAGILPAEAKSGELVVHIDDKTTKSGQLKLA